MRSKANLISMLRNAVTQAAGSSLPLHLLVKPPPELRGHSMRERNLNLSHDLKKKKVKD